MANLCPDYSAFGINADGGHATYVRIPARALAQGNVAVLPDGVPWDEAALAEPLSCVLNGQRAMRLTPGETVVIYGAGPMGLLHVLLAVATGAAQTIVVDPDERRLAQASALGAFATVANGSESAAARIRDLTGGRGVDIAIVAAPVRDIAEEALGLLAPFGRLCLFAGLNGDPRVPLDSNLIHYRNLIVTGTTGGTAADYRAALRLIAARRVDVRPVISHRFPVEQLDQAYTTALAGQGMKIVVTAEA
jgi:L-iditol 2-dehydrogenase